MSKNGTSKRPFYTDLRKRFFLFFFSHQSIKQIGRFLVLYVVLAFVILGLQTIQAYDQYRQNIHLREKGIEELFYWEDVIAKHPNFPDAYYNAALFAYRLDLKDKAKMYLEEAISLDPGFKDAEILKEVIGK